MPAQLPAQLLPAQANALADHRHRITVDWLEDNAVTAAKILDGSITLAKLNSGLLGLVGDITSIDADDAAAAGASGRLADAAHQHGWTTAAPIAIADTASNTEGTAASGARSDHGHAFVLGNMVDYAHVSLAGTQTITTSTTTIVSWDTEVTDNGNLWVSGTPGRFTMPRAGIAVLNAAVDWDANTTERRFCQITKNGVLVASQRFDAVSTNNTDQAVSTGPIAVVLNDFFEVEVFQASGANLNIGGAPTNFSCLLIPT